MPLLEIFAVAFALAMDAFAVALATGVSLQHVSRHQTFRLAWHFGLFQALIPIAGWAAALTVQEHIKAVAPWIAFALLTLLGGRMIIAALRGGDPPHPAPANNTKTVKEPTKGWSLVLLSLATSIDALVVGLSLGMLRVAVWFPALVIGLVAATLTASGLHLGAMIGRHLRLESYADLAGGFILIAIGIRILHAAGVF